MLRASSLGLQSPRPWIRPISQQCLQIRGAGSTMKRKVFRPTERLIPNLPPRFSIPSPIEHPSSPGMATTPVESVRVGQTTKEIPKWSEPANGYLARRAKFDFPHGVAIPEQASLPSPSLDHAPGDGDSFSLPTPATATPRTSGESRTFAVRGKNVIMEGSTQGGRPWKCPPIPPVNYTFRKLDRAPVPLKLHNNTHLRNLRKRPKKPKKSSRKPAESPKKPTKSPKDPRRKFLQVLASTTSATEGWEAYSGIFALLLAEDPPGVPHIPFVHLHRLVRLLARNRPKTRTQFMQLLSVMSTIHNAGGQLHLHEWNALIDNAGKGWRKTRPEDYKMALSIFEDMTTGRAPGTTSSLGDPHSTQSTNISGQAPGRPLTPDVYTYSTLVALAARTLDRPSIRHALNLMQSAGVHPSRITHLSLLVYFSLTHQMSSVRSTLRKMEEQGFGLGIDGVNACIWSYGHNDRLDVVTMIYRLLRHNLDASAESHHNLEEITRQLKEEEGIVILGNPRPDEVTFTVMIQLMAYHGDLPATLTIFADMLGSDNLEIGAALKDGKPLTYSPTMPVFRGIFLGFARHGRPGSSDQDERSLRAQQPATQGPTWALENLQHLFDIFMASPPGQPTQSTVHWIMVAFDKTSNRDLTLLRKVWVDLTVKFNGPFAGPTHRLWKWQTLLFPDSHTTT